MCTSNNIPGNASFPQATVPGNLILRHTILGTQFFFPRCSPRWSITPASKALHLLHLLRERPCMLFSLVNSCPWPRAEAHREPLCYSILFSLLVRRAEDFGLTTSEPMPSH